jgi:hypothetical protein
MPPDSPPLVALPTNLSDDAAVEVLEFLYDLTRVFENYYAAQIHRHDHDIRQSNPPLDQDPPF